MLRAEAIDLYYGASRALRGVSIGAEKGRITCLLGRNGVGKTSLLRALMGLARIRGGRVAWEEEDITGLAPEDRARRGIAFVPQGRDIFPLLSVEENLKTGFAPLRRRDRAVPEEIFSLFPVLSDMLRRRGGDLSGGQQQQLAIARALVTRPRLLILDEPTEGIQPSIIKDIERVIRMLGQRGDMAILLVEQYYEFARALADDIAVMDRGEIVLRGKKDELAEDAVRRHLTV
ncbi:MAG: urea ABC transporter ATP-binding subunit UrtE [Alphaproteobacteria bacterium]|nr:urea ABC transporter ATP-binding subunit UrtE [Alphaproteobacteria bacterium]